MTIDEISKIAKEKGTNIRWITDFFRDWLTCHSDDDILLADCNQNDDFLVAVYSNKTIYLIGKRYPTIMFAPKIMFSINNKTIHIEDVLMKDNNIGNGSIAMRALIKYAKEHEMTKINGYLSEVDNDHKERRNHYYKKFGFNLTDKHLELNL